MLFMIYLCYLWFTYDLLMIHLWNRQGGVCLSYLGKIPLTYYTYDYLWLLIVLMLLMLLMHTYLQNRALLDILRKLRSTGGTGHIVIFNILAIGHTKHPNEQHISDFPGATCDSKKDCGDSNQWWYINSTAFKWATSQ